MRRRSFEKVRDELNRLMAEQLESLRKGTLAEFQEVELRQEEDRLKRISEVCSELSAILRKNPS